MESEYVTTAAPASVDSVHSRRCPPQDPSRSAYYLNDVKLDDYEVTNSGDSPRIRLTLIDMTYRHCTWNLVYESRHANHDIQCSSSLQELKSSRTDESKSFSTLDPVLHRFILELTCVSMTTSLNSDEFFTAYVCWFFLYVWLCVLSHTELRESSLSAE